MRVITLPMYSLYGADYISLLKSIPFGASNSEISIILSEAGEYLPQNKQDMSRFRVSFNPMLNATICMTANIIAVWDHEENVYFVSKNRYDAKCGWFTAEDFYNLVQKEMKQPS